MLLNFDDASRTVTLYDDGQAVSTDQALIEQWLGGTQNPRPYDGDENAAADAAATQATADANADALAGKATQALTSNATYLGLASPTSAQNAAQVKALTRQVNALIRLQVGQLDSTAGT